MELELGQERLFRGLLRLELHEIPHLGDARELVLDAQAQHLRDGRREAVRSLVVEVRLRVEAGVHLVLTGRDFEASGLGSQTPRIPRKRPNGEDFFVSPQPALVSDTTKFAGDYVAFIVADTFEQALDASELVYVDYVPLPSVVDTAIASDNGSPAVWEECPDNISFLHELGPREATDAAIDGAHRVVKQRFVINRIACCSMEVRSCVGHYHPDDDRYVLYAGTQGPHAVRAALANEIFDVPLEKVQVISEDMGGGFGTKAGNYPEHTLCLWASRELGGKPVEDYANDFWLISNDKGGKPVGFITSPWYHPEKGTNIAMGYVPFEGNLNTNGFPIGNFGKKYKVHLPKKYSNKPVNATVVPIPFTQSYNKNTRETN